LSSALVGEVSHRFPCDVAGGWDVGLVEIQI